MTGTGDDLREEVRTRYAAVARTVAGDGGDTPVVAHGLCGAVVTATELVTP